MAPMIETRWLDERLAYDGSQLAAHWILRRTGVAGDAAIAFRGPCRVDTAQIADLADVDGPGIAGADMVHVLVELFDDGDLVRAVLYQRLLTVLAAEVVRQLSPVEAAASLRRDGDDLFLADGKLSISIATRSLVSSLMHFAVNVHNDGAPVRTASLDDLGVEPEPFGRRLLAALAGELASVQAARAKVRGRGESGG